MSRRVEIHSGPDEQMRYFYTLFWTSDYTPGHPAGEHVRRERGQCFFADPRELGHDRLPTADLRHVKPCAKVER